MNNINIEEAYIELFGEKLFQLIKKGIDEGGWYSNERNDEWFPLNHMNYSKVDFRNNYTEFRPKSLNKN